MAPEEVQWFMNLAFEFSNASKINRMAFDDTMRKLEAVCLKRKAQRGDKESPLRCSTAIKRRAITPLIQAKEVQNVIFRAGGVIFMRIFLHPTNFPGN